MDDILEHITERRLNLQAKLEKAQSVINDLREQLLKIEKAEAAIKGQSLTVFKNLQAKPLNVSKKSVSNMTIKQMVILVLQDYPHGLVALDILAKINKNFDRSYERTSLSPQLTRLARSGQLQKNGKLWLLVKDKPSALAEGLSNAGEGWNQHGLPKSTPAGSIPVSSTPNSGTNSSSSSDVSSTNATEHADRKEY